VASSECLDRNWSGACLIPHLHLQRGSEYFALLGDSFISLALFAGLSVPHHVDHTYSLGFRTSHLVRAELCRVDNTEQNMWGLCLRLKKLNFNFASLRHQKPVLRTLFIDIHPTPPHPPPHTYVISRPLATINDIL
jgi:hypothetical protein